MLNIFPRSNTISITFYYNTKNLKFNKLASLIRLLFFKTISLLLLL